MEIATETNKVLDKLAEILGSTGSNVVDAYTEGMLYRGVATAVLGVVFVIIVIVGLRLGMCGLPLLRKDKDSDEGAVFSAVGAIGVLIGVLGLMICIYKAIPMLCAPRAAAIQELIDQLSCF